MLIPKNIIQEIKNRVDIVTIISQYIPGLKKSGKNWIGLCPFHNDRNPSLAVSPQLGIFKCFSCGESGDVIAFIEKIEKLSFNDAVIMLAKKANVTVNFSNYDQTVSLHRDELIQFNERMVRLFQYFLLNKEEGKNALKYLEERGVTLDLIEKFKIGYAIKGYDRILRFLLKKGFKIEFLLQTGLFSKEGGRVKTIFFDRIIFPIFNHNSECVGFGGRALGINAKPKYINTSETIVYKKSNTLYGLELAKKSIMETKKVFLVEGYMDVISCHKAGIENVVAPCGTAVTREQIQLLSRYADELIFLMDGDDAGKKGVIKGLNESVNILVNKAVVILPENLDPDDYFKTHSLRDFEELLKTRIDGFDFLIKYYTENIEKKDRRALLAALANIFDYISRWESDVIKNSFIERIAEYLNLDKILVAKEFLIYKNKIRKVEKQDFNNEEKVKKDIDVRLKREIELFLLLSQLEDGKDLIKRCGLREEHLINTEAQQLYKDYLNLRNDEFYKNFLNYFDDDRVKIYIQDYFFKSEELKQGVNVIKNSIIDRIIEIIKYYYDMRNSEITEEIKYSQLYRDEERIKELQEEKTIIIDEILKLSKLQELKT